jgi:chemotaxis protein CheD
LNLSVPKNDERCGLIRLALGQSSVIPKDAVASALVGTCLGLFLYDPVLRIAAATRVALPESRGAGPKGKYADTAPDHLLERIEAEGGVRQRLIVKWAGAGAMFGNTARENLHEMNSAAVTQSLSKLGLRPHATHCGGDSGRQLYFDTHDGSLRVVSVTGDSVEI